MNDRQLSDEFGCLYWLLVVVLMCCIVIAGFVAFVADENEKRLDAIEANVRIILKHERNAAMRPLARPEGIER